MVEGEERALFIVPNFTEGVFSNGVTLCGFLRLTGMNSASLYFAANLQTSYGNLIQIGYRAGTWYFEDMPSDLTNLTSGTATPNSDYVASGSAVTWKKVGRVVIVNFDFVLSTAINGVVALFSGLPSSVAPVWFSVAGFGDGSSRRLRISGEQVQNYYGDLPAQGYNGQAVYFTT